MLRRACLAFWMLPRSGFLFLRNTSSCCCPAQRPRTHSLFTCGTRGQASRYCGLNNDSESRLCSRSHFDDSEAEIPPIQHNDLVLVGSFVEDVAQGEE